MKLLKRTLAMLLVLTMVLGMVPFAAFAEETTEGTEGTLPVPTHMNTKPADGTVTGQPFNDAESVSRNYRIPGLVNHNGTLVAVADVRYNEEYDGGGIDIVVSRSADGNTWNYTFPAYLGDNGNIHARNSSTLMDPLVISDGTNLYLFYDMFTAGYSLAGGNNTTNAFWATGTGFDSQGRLRLGATYDARDDASWNYYLEDGLIKDSDGNAVEGYTVDAWFNVYQNGTYVSNLFFATGSPFYAYPASYIAMQTSTDGGSNWSDPQLLNIKENGPTWEVLGPGTGLVTMDGNLAFTTYDNTNIYLIYGKDNDWSIVKTPSATNESSIVELADGTIRAFVKNRNNQICYVDFTKTETGYTAGGMVNTGCPSQSWCMVSSMYYSKTLGGKDVILVTCPTSSNGRYYGKMHVFTLNDDNTMNFVDAYEINGADDFFAYSDMAELEDGSIALLYEDDCKYYNWTDDREHASHISYRKVNLETELDVEFDVDYDVFVWNADNSAGEIRVPTATGVNHVHVQPKTLDTMTVDYSAYDMVLCKDEEDNCTAEFACANVHIGKAIVSLALTDALKAADDVKGFVVEADGSINSVFDVENDGEYVTFEAPHFSVVGIAAMTEEEIIEHSAVPISLRVGQTHTVTVEGTVTVDSNSDSTAASAQAEATQLEGEKSLKKASSIDATKQYLIVNTRAAGTSAASDPTHSMLLNTTGTRNNSTALQMGGPATTASTDLWTVTPTGETDKYTITRNGKYLTIGNDTSNVTDTETVLTVVYASDGNGTGWVISEGSYYLSDTYGTSSTLAHGYGTRNDGGNYWDLYEIVPGTPIDATTITFTGLKAGSSTLVMVGDTAYYVTVEDETLPEERVDLYVDETKTITDETGKYTVSEPPVADIATVTVTGSDTTETSVSTEKATELEAGATYIMRVHGSQYVLSANVTTHTAWGANNRAYELNANLTPNAAHLWTLETADGGFKLKNGDSYLALGNTNNHSELNTTGEVFTLTYTDSGWTICNPYSRYINALGGNVASASVGGWTGDGTRFDLYKATTTVTGRTEITFTGVAEGDTQAIIGNTRYNIYVTEREQEIVDVDLYVGETKDYTIDGTAYTDANVTKADNADTVVQTQVVGDHVDGKELRVATEIISGRKYMLMNTRVDETLRNEPSGNNRLYLNGTLNAEDTTAIWTITAVEGRENGYTVQDVNNKYLQIPAGGQAGLSDASVTLVVEPNGTDNGNVKWQIKQGGQLLNSHDGSNDAGGYGTNNDGGSQWVLYEVAESSTEVTFTGLTEGETQVTVGHVRYNITVSYRKVEVTANLGIPTRVPVSGTVTQDAIDQFNAKHGETVTVALDGDELVFTGVTTGNVTVILGDTQYVVTSAPCVVDITLHAGISRTLTIDGFNYTEGEIQDTNSALLVSVKGIEHHNKELRAITSLDDLVSGKQYVLVNNRAADGTPKYSVLTNEDNAGGLNMTGPAAPTIKELWTIDEATGGYTIHQGAGYLTFQENAASVIDTEHPVLTLEYTSTNFGTGWLISLNGSYLSDHGGNSSNFSKGYNTRGDSGNYWTIYEIVELDPTYSTEVTFKGVTAGTTTTAQVGHVTYNITVEKNDIRNITLYVGVTQNDFIDGYGYDNTQSTQPDNTYAYIHSVTTENGDTKVVFSGVAKTPEGKVITATVGHVIYHITVEDLHSGEDVPGFNCVIGEGEYESGANVTENLNGKEVKSLRISEGMEFNLGVDITDADTITWENTDPTIATVDETGKITAVSEGTTLIKATVTKNGVSETMAVHVTVVPSLVEGYSADEICHVVYYIDTVHMTAPFYTMFLSSENTTGPVAEHTMVMVSEAEVIVLQRPKEAAFALVWTSDPWDNHALTYMAATGTRGEYFPLQSDNGVLETGTVNGIEYYKGSQAYNNIINAGNAAGASWQAAFDALLEYNVHVGEDIWQEFGCDGAMSMSRNPNDNYPNTATSLSFISEKLPEVSKTVNGILPASGNQSDWQLYQEGMYASVGQHVYFTLSVTQDAPRSWQLNQDGSFKYATDEDGNVLLDAEGNELKLSALVYQGTANLIDRLMRPVTDENGNTTYEPITHMANPPYFYTKELDIQDGDRVDNGGGDAAGFIDGFIVNQELKKNSQDIVDDLNKGWTAEEIAAGQRTLEYYVVYTIQESDNNSLLINGAGLTYEYSSAYSDGESTKTGTADAKLYVLGASLGDVVVDFGLPVTIDGLTSTHMADRFNEENTNNAIDGAMYGYVDIDQKEDGTYSVTYTPDTILQGYDVVYLMDEYNNLLNYFRVYPATTVFYEEGFLLDNNNGWNAENATKGTEGQTYETLEQKGEVNPYGYDPIYADDLNGASGSYISANTIGANTSFTFTGTGFDLYANCDSESGYVAITVRKNNADDSKTVVKLMTVNTKAKAGDSAATAGQGENQYHMPIVSVQDLDHATYTVEIRKILQIERNVIIDGVRIYNTVADTSVFKENLEDAPKFFEMRDYVLKEIGIGDDTSGQYGSLAEMAGQIYAGIVEDNEVPEAVITDNDTIFGKNTVQDLLDNGPKNELFLYANQSLTFKVNTSRIMQLGLKAPTGAPATYQIQVNGATVKEGTMNTTVDMFYELNDPTVANIASQATITATGDNENDSEGSANLVDGATNTLYKFYNAAMTDEQSVTLTFDETRKMNAMAIAFENVGETDGNNYAFTYSILARNGSGEYDTLVDHATANRTDDSSQSYTFPEKTYSEVKIVMHSCKSGENNGWPAIAEFEVYSGVEHTVTVTNTGNAILSVTKLKICDDPNAKFVPLTVEDIELILLAAGYPADEEEGDTTTPSTPEATTPEETKPVETTHEESKPVVTTPEETKPENTGCAKDDTCILSKFSDIVATEWYHDGVHFCVAEGLMNGMGEGIFAPNDPTTRAQLVTMLYRLMGSPKAEGRTEPFADVAEGEWYYDAIVWAYSENVVKGISETEFAPNANVTREQVATILHRFLATPEGTGKLDSFSDAASVSDYAEDALVWAVGEGLINGVAQTDGKVLLDPTGTATRTQIATILYRYLENA